MLRLGEDLEGYAAADIDLVVVDLLMSDDPCTATTELAEVLARHGWQREGQGS
jgi:hypothetical protein